MLHSRLMDNHAGMVLMGDYGSLKTLHAIISDIGEHSPVLKNNRGLASDVFLGLASDVRHAYEGQKIISAPPSGYPEMGFTFGVEIIWPVLLVQQKMMRFSLDYMVHTSRHQAMAYMLEAVIEDAIRDDFKDKAQDVLTAWRNLSVSHPAAVERLGTRSSAFCSWTGQERLQNLGDLLDSLDPMNDLSYGYQMEPGVHDKFLNPAVFSKGQSNLHSAPATSSRVPARAKRMPAPC